MRKSGFALALMLCLGLGSCAAGPHQLRRSVDDWDHKMYVQSPWIDAVLWIVPLFPMATTFAWLGDSLIGDAISFWGHDAWDGKGTGFKHFEVTPVDGAMSSLLMEDGKFLEIK